MFDSRLSTAGELCAYQSTVATSEGQPGTVDPSRIPAGSYRVDSDHTHVVWTVNHMGFSLLEGMFGAVGGSMTIHPEGVAGSHVEVEFNIDDPTVTSNAFARHLKSTDLFDTGRFPLARFVSTEVIRTSADRATVSGELTLRGITKPVELQSLFVGAGRNPMNDELNFGFTAIATLRRSDFGLDFIVPAVSDIVKLRINAAFKAE